MPERRASPGLTRFYRIRGVVYNKILKREFIVMKLMFYLIGGPLNRLLFASLAASFLCSTTTSTTTRLTATTTVLVVVVLLLKY